MPELMEEQEGKRGRENVFFKKKLLKFRFSKFIELLFMCGC